MGQYWIPVNLDKREFINPHKLGAGLKLWEQLVNHPGTGGALVVLCAAMPEQRGGGDFRITPKSKNVIGRWAGDRIALIGDYTEDGDLPEEFKASIIYELCCSKQDLDERKKSTLCGLAEGDDSFSERRVKEMRQLQGESHYKDITSMVCRVIEDELGGKFENGCWHGPF